jgi:Uma2 family endonuclease
MTDRARRLMTVEEFLEWDDGTDTRYELVDGVPIAMAPPMGTRRTIAANAATLVNVALDTRPPCRAEVEAGVRRGTRSYYVADVSATCEAPDNAGPLAAPFLIVEILSPSTRAHDLRRKLPFYKTLPSLREIWLIDSERRWVQVWRREGEAWAEPQDLVGPAAFDSPALRSRIALDRLYRNTLL